jgi:hypothetical protein
MKFLWPGGRIKFSNRSMRLLFFVNILENSWSNVSLPWSPGPRMSKFVLDNACVFDLAGIVLVVKGRDIVKKTRRRRTGRCDGLTRHVVRQ